MRTSTTLQTPTGLTPLLQTVFKRLTLITSQVRQPMTRRKLKRPTLMRKLRRWTLPSMLTTR
ncbi:hypothetical protein IV71_GL000858 [Fructobacillus fructosus KCTC 3544]|nr:hypothetical protein IV71_GL000858 [Fructobacillus fructosus KCTC 3544]